MATVDTGDFWSKAGPGMIDFGLGMYSRNSAMKEAEERLKRARGPLYDQSMAAAGGMLNQAAGFDPQVAAEERFAKQQALLKPVQDKALADYMRTLHAKGQLGTATYEQGLEGGTTGAGMLANPKLASFFAAQNAQRSKDAYAAMDKGQSYLDNILNRAGMLQRSAADTQRAGLEAMRTQPSRAASNHQLLKGGLGILKDSGVMGDIFKPGGMIGGAMDWLKGVFNPAPVMPAPIFEMPQIFDVGSSDWNMDWSYS
jgi:hypothetical protein